MGGRCKVRGENLKGWCFIFLSREDYGGFCQQTLLETKKVPWWIKHRRGKSIYTCIFIYLFWNESCYTRARVCNAHYNLIRSSFTDKCVFFVVVFFFSLWKYMQVIWKRSTEKTNHCNLYPTAVRSYDEPPVKTEMDSSFLCYCPHHPWQMEQQQRGLFEWVVTFGSPSQVWVIFHPPSTPLPLWRPISGLHQKWTCCPRFRLTPHWQTKGHPSSCLFPPRLTHLLQQGKLGPV